MQRLTLPFPSCKLWAIEHKVKYNKTTIEHEVLLNYVQLHIMQLSCTLDFYIKLLFKSS